MTTLNCIAVDDELLALKKMERFCEQVEYLNLLGTFTNAIDTLHFLKYNEVHLILLDIQMDEFTGIQLIKALENPPMVILTTAFESYAIEGYSLNVLDYLLKPIQFDRFMQAVEKAKKQFKLEKVYETKHVETEQSEHIYIKSGTSIQKIICSDIDYIVGMKDYLLVKTPQKKYMTLMNFSKMLEILPDNNFVRIHKSFIVPLDKVDSVKTTSVQIGEREIPIGGTYRKAFLQHFEQVRKQ